MGCQTANRVQLCTQRSNQLYSVNAATEQHADTKSDEDDLSTTKALTRGTQDVNDGNVGCIQDPCMSSEASAQGTSTNCAETTPVMLESTLPHETQIELQSSLPLTPRLPIEGKPSECKQEQAESVVTAGCTNRTVQLANPTETDADVNRTALLGGEPAERVCRVDEGDGEHESQSRIQQTYFYCEEDRQHNRNATENIPITYGLLLEGEWTVYPSGEASDSRSNTNVFNAAIEHVDGLGESTETTNTKEVESEGCSGGMDKRASVDEVGGNAGHRTGPTDTSNELTEFITLSIKTEDPDSGDIPCMYIGGTKHLILKPNGFGDITETSSTRTDVHSVEDETETSENETEIISNRRNGSKTRNSPYTYKIVTSNPTYQWKQVSDGNGDVYIPWNVPVRAQGQIFVFGQAESRV